MSEQRCETCRWWDKDKRSLYTGMCNYFDGMEFPYWVEAAITTDIAGSKCEVWKGKPDHD